VSFLSPLRRQPVTTTPVLRIGIAAAFAGVEDSRFDRFCNGAGLTPLDNAQHEFVAHLLFRAVFVVLEEGVQRGRRVIEKRPANGPGGLKRLIIQHDMFYQKRGQVRGTGDSPHGAGPLMDAFEQFFLVAGHISKKPYRNSMDSLDRSKGEPEMWVDGMFVEYYIDANGEERVAAITSPGILLEFGVGEKRPGLGEKRDVKLKSKNLEECVNR
jgi:hypothetical protein